MSSKTQFSLIGRRILVTGAGQGIGRAIAGYLTDLGASVMVNDLSEERAASCAGTIGAAGHVAADVAQEDDVEQMFKSAIEQLGGLDSVVSNAGIAEPIKATRNQELADWRRVIDVNLQGVFLVGREASRHIKSDGAIVNVASVAGITPFSASNGYGVSKAGVAMMTKTMACDLARFNIRVNAIAPGIVESEMAGDLIDQTSPGQNMFARRIPLGRLGQPQDIAAATAFLLSDFAQYITGVVLPVDGGWSAFGGAGDASKEEAVNPNPQPTVNA